MDRPRHPQVIRTWKVERIRKAGDSPKKLHQQKPTKNEITFLQQRRIDKMGGRFEVSVDGKQIFSNSKPDGFRTIKKSGSTFSEPEEIHIEPITKGSSF
jgi:hypothetical protein